jgi:peptidoglycan/LPS O-acetylase OafA/YrhL
VALETVKTDTSSFQKHLPVLDGVRGLAILMVLFGHFYQRALFVDWPLARDILGRAVRLGGYGVELFFVLSGFLITGILVDSEKGPKALGRFYARRFLRIFPLYYGCLVVLLVFLPRLIPIDQGAQTIAANQKWLWYYLINWPSVPWIWDESKIFQLGHFWSLCVEEQFYFIWPLLVFILPQRMLPACCGLVLLLGLGSRVVTALFGASAPFILQWTTLHFADALAMGGLLALAVRDPKLGALLPSRRMLGVLISSLALVVLFYTALPRRFHMELSNAVNETFVVSIFGMILLWSVRSQSGEWTNRILSSRALMSFGKYSYGLYVIHGIMRPQFATIWNVAEWPKFMGSPLVYMILYWLMASAVCFGIAYGSYTLIERRFLALKKFFPQVERGQLRRVSEGVRPSVPAVVS